MVRRKIYGKEMSLYSQIHEAKKYIALTMSSCANSKSMQASTSHTSWLTTLLLLNKINNSFVKVKQQPRKLR